jgi:hypothetical protein
VNTSTLHLLGKSNSTCTSNTLVLEHYPVGTYKYCERAGKQRPDQQQKQCDMRTPQFDTSVRFYTSISFAKSQFLISLYSSAAVCSGPWSTCWNRITFLRTTGSQPLTTWLIRHVIDTSPEEHLCWQLYTHVTGELQGSVQPRAGAWTKEAMPSYSS